MDRLLVLKYAKQAGIVSQDADSVEHVQGNLGYFVELISREVREYESRKLFEEITSIFDAVKQS